MDWGLIFFILAIVFLVGHLGIDGYRMFRHVRRLRHIRAETGWEHLCPRCVYIQDGLSDMRHEAAWTVAAVLALAGHITLDFVG